MLTKPQLVAAYTDGSSDSDCDRGEGGIFFIYSSGRSSKEKVSVGKIDSNNVYKFVAIREVLSIYLMDKTFGISDGIIMFLESKSALEAIKNSMQGSVQVFYPGSYFCE